MNNNTVLLFLLFLGVFIQTQTADLEWWKTAVFYQIYPRSFKDSDNNGIGDLGGIIQKIDHLSDLGITAIWLSPIFKSPQVDHGYDISDFRDVDPLFGNLDTLKQLVTKCHEKGIKVILDFVPNHTSDQHEWFSKSKNQESGYENFYVWKNGASSGKAPNNWISHFHGSAWEYSEKRGQYYLHQFAIGQPDLNYREPEVVKAMKAVLVFWLDFGVDGFRMDIVPALYEHPDFLDEPPSNDPTATSNDHAFLNHIYTYDQPETYDMVHQWRTVIDNYQTEKGGDARVMMVETYSPDQKALDFYGTSTKAGAHFPFNFWLITKLNKNSKATEIKNVIEKWLNYTESNSYVANWVLGNHDQHRVATRYGVDRIDGVAIMALLLPGVGVIYNGEEIGMEDGEVTWAQGADPQACNGLQKDFDKNSRDFQRTPYQWDDTLNAGFNDGYKPWLPVSSKYVDVNLKKQQVNDQKSHYRIYQALLKARKSDTLKYGKAQLLALNDNVLVLIRRHTKSATYIAVINIGNMMQFINLKAIVDLPDQASILIKSVNSKRAVGDSIETKSTITLEKFEAFVATATPKNDAEDNNNNNNTSSSARLVSPHFLFALGVACITFIIKIN